jgi:hypothetical protein
MVEGAEGSGLVRTREFVVFFVIFIPALGVGAQETWKVRLDGVGPVKVGMTLAQLNAALHEKFSNAEAEGGPSCFYVRPKNHSAIAFMIEDGHLVRIDVDKPSIPTDKIISVGDSEEQVKKAYGSEITTEPSKYTGDEGGRYLTFRSPDGKLGIRFETEKGKVSTFYAGTYEAIQYVEGCE